MTRRFLRSFESSFKSNVKNELRLVNQDKERDVFTHHMSKDEAAIAEIFADSLGVNSQLFISQIIEAELHRMIRIKKRRADFEGLNDFYKDAIIIQKSALSELKNLVANYLPIPIAQLQNERLIRYAKTRLGLRFNNYQAYKLASFDGKSSIEVLFYLDNASSTHYRNAWLGIQGQPLKQLTFSSIKTLCEYHQHIFTFAETFAGGKNSQIFCMRTIHEAHRQSA
jgi:hypothetical protein